MHASSFLKRFAVLGIAILAMLAVSFPGWAQSTTTGAISGTAVDPQGLAVPNATVKVHNMGTGEDKTSTANGAGEFRVVELQPGSYTVTISAGGFSTVEQQNVVVEVGRVTSLDLHMVISTGTETVQVTADTPLLNTTSQDFSSNFNQTFINNLPTNGRRWTNFAILSPGVALDGGFGLLSFRGISGLLNNNTVDGGDNNQAFFSEERGRTRINYVVSQDSIREFQVNTSNYSAEYGRAAGGVVNAVTKSGTNSFHGDAFYFIRDNYFGATNPFTKGPTGLAIKPDDRRQQFGGSIGGPIKKDKVFIFFSYDQSHRTNPAVALPTGPPFSFLDPAILSAADRTLLAGRGVTPAQITAGLTFLQGITGVVRRKGDQTIFFPKIDWHLNPNNTLTMSYNRMRWASPAGVQSAAVVNLGTHSLGSDYVHDDSLIIRLTTLVTPTTTNEFLFQFGRDNEFEFSQPPGPGEPRTGPGGGVPDVAIDSPSFEFGKPTFLDRKALPLEKRYQFADTFSVVQGKHLVKFGVDVNRVHDLDNNLFLGGGSFEYSNLPDFLTDNAGNPQLCGTVAKPVPCYLQYQQAFGQPAFQFSTVDYSAFIQDSWKILPRFTLNFGLRYELEALPRTQIPNPAVPQTNKFPHDTNNLGPRVGFAWDVWGSGKTALRGGYGIYYGRIINSTIVNAIENTATATSQLQFTIQPGNPPNPVYPNTLPAATGRSFPPAVIFFAPGYENPMIHQADLTIEQSLGWHTMFSASYLLSLGRHLPTFADQNLNPLSFVNVTYPIFGGFANGKSFTIPVYTGARPNPAFGAFGQVSDIISSRYDALVVQLNRRLARSLQFQSSYTWAHATDDGQGSVTFTHNNDLLDVFNPKLDHGRSLFDKRSTFVASAVWSPEPFKDDHPAERAIFNGFTFAPIVYIASGVPVTSFVSGTPGSAALGGARTQGSGIFGLGGANYIPILGRNRFTSPSIRNVNLRMSRRFRITEGTSLELIAEGFNIFNHTNFTGVTSTAYSIRTTSAGSPTGGCASVTGTPPPAGTALLCANSFFLHPFSASNTLFDKRQIQFAARFQF